MKDLAKDSLALIRMAGKITRRQYLAGIEEINKKYPGVGFDLERGKLWHFYHENKIELDEIPNNALFEKVSAKGE